jgi:hypothetical protein
MAISRLSVSSISNGFPKYKNFWDGASVVVPVVSGRLVTTGGWRGTNSAVMQYIEAATTGNSTTFGNLTVAGSSMSQNGGSSTRGLIAGGYNRTTTIDYITIATTGDATSFGSLTAGGYEGPGSGSNSTRSITFGALGRSTTIDYVTIASTGNATTFGTCSTTQGGAVGGSDTRLIFGNDASNNMQYVTISTTGNSTSFGTSGPNAQTAGASNKTRFVLNSGSSGNFEYVTVATTGNTVTFGNSLNGSGGDKAAQSGGNRGIWFGGYSAGYKDWIEYITISTTGNGTSFGSLGTTMSDFSACSSAHGGLI